jgi:hypothetical protein
MVAVDGDNDSGAQSLGETRRSLLQEPVYLYRKKKESGVENVYSGE